jgi:hypothetical protein
MRKLSYFLAVGILTATTVFIGCKKKSDPTPDANPSAKVYQSVITTNNGGNSGTANVVASVTTTDGTAKIRLNVTSTSNIGYIYILQSYDNGSATPLQVSTFVDSTGKTYTGGSSSYSLSMSNIKSFIIDIPVTIRNNSTAVTDVYTIWFTDRAGDFGVPTKRRVLGPATVTFRYTAAAPTATYTSFSASLGNQLNSAGSLLSTSGQGGVIKTADYDSSATSADLSLSALNSGGTTITGANSDWLISPDYRTTVGFLNEPAAPNPLPNTTAIAAYTGSVTFDAAAASDILALADPSGNKVQISAGAVYVFKTAAGKKGLLQVGSSYVYSSVSAGTVPVSVKVLN